VSDKDTDAGGEQIKVEAKNESKKVAIDDKRLAKALKAISENEYTKEELLKTFELTPEQLKNIAQ
jgi:DNA-directed RNA polymerase subunit H (RpoH/RPB5)